MSKGKKLTCTACEELIQGEVYFGDDATHYEGKPLCETCYYEDEPVATLYHNQDEDPYHISLARNDTGGQFLAKWHSTDPWRGRYELSSESYAMVFSDAILAYHESEAMLKELNDKAIERFTEASVDFYRAFLRTSNLFCTNYDIWIKKDPAQILAAHLILQGIKTGVDYDNPLYSTGIIFDRETLGKLQTMLGHKYQIESDSDVLKLVEEKGEDLLQEIKSYCQEESKRGKV
jgi:hypothetical protein